MKDPKIGTGKKPKGSGRRLYTDENPKDTVGIKFATPADARATVSKVKKISKPFARKIQILTVGEQRAKVMGKSKVASIFKKGKDAIRKDVDKTWENEAEPPAPMVQISLKEYDKLKENSKYITDKSLISVIDKIEELVRALRKHIVRKEID